MEAGTCVAMPPEAGGGAVIERWFVIEGEVVTEGKQLLRYNTSGGGSRSLPCPAGVAGLVARIFVRAGGAAKPGEAVCSVEPCPHDETFHDICTTCGEPAEAGPREGLFGGVAHPELRRSQQGVAKQHNQRAQELQAKKKLALVLDLDHTLLHTAFPTCDLYRNVMVRVMDTSPRDVFRVDVKGRGRPLPRPLPAVTFCTGGSTF